MEQSPRILGNIGGCEIPLRRPYTGVHSLVLLPPICVAPGVAPVMRNCSGKKTMDGAILISCTWWILARRSVNEIISVWWIKLVLIQFKAMILTAPPLLAEFKSQEGNLIGVNKKKPRSWQEVWAWDQALTIFQRQKSRFLERTGSFCSLSMWSFKNNVSFSNKNVVSKFGDFCIEGPLHFKRSFKKHCNETRKSVDLPWFLKNMILCFIL